MIWTFSLCLSALEFKIKPQKTIMAGLHCSHSCLNPCNRPSICTAVPAKAATNLTGQIWELFPCASGHLMLSVNFSFSTSEPRQQGAFSWTSQIHLLKSSSALFSPSTSSLWQPFHVLMAIHLVACPLSAHDSSHTITASLTTVPKPLTSIHSVSAVAFMPAGCFHMDGLPAHDLII